MIELTRFCHVLNRLCSCYNIEIVLPRFKDRILAEVIWGMKRDLTDNDSGSPALVPATKGSTR